MPPQCGEGADAQRADEHAAQHRRDQAAEQVQGVARAGGTPASRIGEQVAAGREEDHPGNRRAAGWPGAGRAAGQGRDDRHPGDLTRRAAGRQRRGQHGEGHDDADYHPGQAERIDAVTGAGLQAGHVGQPDQETGHGPGEASDHPDERAVDDHDLPHVAVGGAQGADHAERPEPTPRQYREAGPGDQAGEQQAGDGQDEHDDRRAEPAPARRRLQRRLLEEVNGRRGIEQDDHGIRCRDLPLGDKGELVTQVVRVLHRADYVPDASRGVPLAADADVVEGGDLRRQRNLTGRPGSGPRSARVRTARTGRPGPRPAARRGSPSPW